MTLWIIAATLMPKSLARAVLVTYPDKFTLEEAKSLVEAADRKVLNVFTQKYLNHSEYGIGSGKAKELEEYVKESGADQIIVDEHLTPRQIFNLEKLTGVQVVDRERLILDIFYSRATSNEAKLQIQLAEIKYDMPRVREIAKITSGKERAGKGGSGEYVVDVKFRDLRRRMEFIKEKLDEAKKKRQLYQRQRMKADMPVVSLVGYTSAGKTTLFNLLAAEQRETAASLFTTLSTTTRSVKLDDERERILLTDTVGFISRLPTYMIEAFKSTLEESLAADLILLMVDCSEGLEEIKAKYYSCWNVLRELGVDESKVHVVLTKYDGESASSSDVQKIPALTSDLKIQEPILISSKTGYGIRRLKNTVRLLLKAGPSHTQEQPPQ
ncbi:MAG TPA: GTPase HflX [Nitrososphaera sp.]|nr:GTPase HflX [Nitrososphaera sp.]